ncbi:hypothetical protein OWV82_001773 [Melia azedarach]|uniref:Uncharacterized protein n=1 Tax=Melia azedarach TaxID=155640 RepID=A0ACC1Z0J9_MELAZ|nr:hypothetical protein OWV82_001773 [Melia azedarach]
MLTGTILKCDTFLLICALCLFLFNKVKEPVCQSLCGVLAGKSIYIWALWLKINHTNADSVPAFLHLKLLSFMMCDTRNAEEKEEEDSNNDDDVGEDNDTKNVICCLR